jgi:hypothetical protein
MSPKRPAEVKLPHPDIFQRALEQIRVSSMEERTRVIAGTEVRYWSCTPWPEGMDPGIYDGEGNIYVSHRVVERDSDEADLTAFHEQTEIDIKAAARNHAYAHRRALLLELLAVKTIFLEPERQHRFVDSRVGAYPDWKGIDKAQVASRIWELLSAERPPRGKLFDVIKEA